MAEIIHVDFQGRGKGRNHPSQSRRPMGAINRKWRPQIVHEFGTCDLGVDLDNVVVKMAEMKEQYPGSMTLFESGDFVQAFFEDAVILSRLFGMTAHDVVFKGKSAGTVCGSSRTIITADLVQSGYQTVIYNLEQDKFRVITPGHQGGAHQ